MIKKIPIIRVDGSKSGDDDYRADAYLALTNSGGVSIQVSDGGDEKNGCKNM